MADDVLFICTGNYYRSRYAEALFNHLAAAARIEARAFSRGLATEMITYGEISHNTLEACGREGIACDLRKPIQIREEDFAKAKRVIALKDAEHRPMMRRMFAHWAEKIDYWHVHDIDFAEPEIALAEIRELVQELVTTYREK